VKKNLDAVLGQLRNVRAARPQLLDAADDDAVDALHHHDVLPAVIPVNLRHVEQRGPREIALQLRRVAGLAHQIEFIGDGFAILAHDFHGPHGPRLDPVFVGEPCQGVEHFKVEIDDLAHARAQHLHHHFVAVLQGGRVHLRDGCRGKGRRFEAAEYVRKRPAEGFLDHGDGNFTGERRHAILQFCQLIGDVDRQQVAARRERLAELDENRPQFLERQAQPLAARPADAALEPGPG